MTSDAPVPAPPVAGRAWLRSSVILVLLTRTVQLAAAPVTLWLVATRRPLAEQGLYFIFWNVQGLTQLMELGVGNLVVNFASHESPRLALGTRGEVSGDAASRERLLTMLRDAQAWYRHFAAWFIVLVGALGALLFHPSATGPSVGFLVPWAITTGFVAMYLSLVPRLCTVEGAGGLIPLQRMRLAQALVATPLHWVVLWTSGALWAVATFAVAWFAFPWAWLRLRYPVLAAWHAAPAAAAMRTGADFAAVQRRAAATWLAVWAAPQVLTPVVLLTHGAAAAGQVGMTLAIAMAPSVLAGAWLQARYPRYAALLARGESAALAALARRASAQASVVATAGIVAAALAAWWLPQVAPSLAGRMLGPSAIVLLGFTSLLWLLAQSLSSYLRAWRTEPLTGAIVAAAIVSALASALAASLLSLAATVVAHAVIVPVVLVALLAGWYSQARRRGAPQP